MIRNKYIIVDDYIIIYAKMKNEKNFEVIVDLDDLPIIDEWDSAIHIKHFKGNDSYYAEITKYLGRIENKLKYKSILLHRLLMNVYDQKILIDHKNFNTLDNRKDNLRIVDKSGNGMHRKSENSNNKLKCRNVCFVDGWYIVQLQINKKNTLIGRFKTVEEANDCAIKMREKYYQIKSL